MAKQQLIVICGPTATGKTALAVDVARELSGEVVSADSMQVYRGMDIGTAKPAMGERRGIPHHLFDCADPGEEFSAAIYRERARECISGIAARGNLPILCGGTGFYISATVYPLEFSNASADEQFRNQMLEYARQHGNNALHALLQNNQPEAAALIHPNNVRRVIRALERTRTQYSPTDGTNQLFSGTPLYDMAWIGLKMEREALYRRIDRRVDEMMRQGLPDEVRRLAAVHGEGSQAFQALGYKELICHFRGETSLEEAVERIKTGSRNYAKRQMTWFRREKAVHWFDAGSYPDRQQLSEAAIGYLRETLHMS